MKKDEAKKICLDCFGSKVIIDVNDFMNEELVAPIAVEASFKDKTIGITGVVDDSLNVIVPFRMSEISHEEFDNLYFKNAVNVYKNYHAIYHAGDDDIYVIDLKTVTFKKEGNKIIPENYLIRMDSYNVINYDYIIVYKDVFKSYGESYIYNVSEAKKIGDTYNFVAVGEGEPRKFYAGFVTTNNEYIKPILVMFEIGPNTGMPIDNKVLLGKRYLEGTLLSYEVKISLPKRIVGNKKEVINYCDNYLNLYVKMMRSEVKGIIN